MTEKLNVNQYVQKIQDYKGILIEKIDLQNLKRPLVLDIGCGNGEALIYEAVKNSNRNYLGIELQYKEIYRTAKKISEQSLDNCNVIRINANEISEHFSANNIDEVNIFFPDPWTKRKQKKHRLIQIEFLKKLVNVIKKDGRINIKTDDNDYFLHICYVVNFLVSENIINIKEFSRDIHATEYAKKFCITPFEKIFLSQKLQINYICCTKRND